MAITVERLNTTNPAYDAEQLEDCHALHTGGAAWRARRARWFPQHPQEVQSTYDHRISRTTYENNAGAVLDMVKGLLFSVPPRVSDWEAPWTSAWLRDVDGLGSNLATWGERFFAAALVEQRAFAWVNLPSRQEEFANLADQEAAGALDPFLVLLTGRGIIDWERDARGALVWLMHRGVDYPRSDIGEPRRKRYTWTYISREEVRRWQWLGDDMDSEPHDDDVPKALPPVRHGFRGMPGVELALKDEEFMAGKLRDPAVELTRQQNDLHYALYRAAHPVLWVRSKWTEEDPKIGPGVWFQLRRDTEGSDEMGYVEPAGTSFALLADRVTKTREGLYRVVSQMAQSADGNATRAQMSGRSKAADWKATEVLLADYAALVKPALVQILRLVSRVRDTEMTPTIAGLEGWHDMSANDWLVAAAQATTVIQYSEHANRMIALEEVRRLFPHAREEDIAKVADEVYAADIDLELIKTGARNGGYVHEDPSDPNAFGGE